MTINIKPANTFNPAISRKFMKSMASGGLARFIMLEAFVESGRTYQAYQRGGFDEARERITEEFTGAVFWLGGVKAFNKINDKIGKKILNMKTANFDIGKDKARDTVGNFIHNETNIKTGAKFTESQIATFKATKLIASILMANAMIGFVVPKINQGITRFLHRNDNKNDNTQQPQPQTAQITNNTQQLSLNNFVENSKTQQNNKDIAFSGGADAIMKLAFNLENNTTWQLLSTDVGTTTGRTLSARNNNERREIMFRDLSSIFFYMFNMPLMNKFLNKLEQNGRGSRVDSINADYATDLMKQIVNDKGGKISADELKDIMIGKEFTLPEAIKSEFKDGYMTLEAFKEKLSSMPELNTSATLDKYKKLADDMAKLQPEVKGEARITLEQAERMFKGGYLNNPEFLKNLYELAFGRNKKLDIANFLNPYKFISSDSVESVDNDLKYFVEQIIEKAKKSGKDITESTLEKAAKNNFKFNVLNWGTGFGISALFLSTIIPKMQYWITKQITGSNEFPGTAEFRKNQQTQNNNMEK